MSLEYSQLHYEVLKLTLPSVSGTCTISGSDGYGTPLTCDQATNSTDTIKFTNSDAPLIPESNVYRVITSISETTTKLEPGKGLASRGTLTISFEDFKGDPNKDSPALVSDPSIKNKGTFFGKLQARNILANRVVELELHTKTQQGNSYPNAVQSRKYLVESLQNSGKGKYQLKCKDVMSQINFDEHQYPSNDAGYLRLDVTDSTTSIPVDADTTYAVNDVIIVNDEFMLVTGVANIGTASATLTVQTRGANIAAPYTSTLTRTENDSHSAGDSVFVCRVSDAERIDDFIEDMLLDAGMDAALIANSKPSWTTEVDEWLTGESISTIWYKQESANEILTSVLTDFMLDIWYEPTEDLIKLAAISEWQSTSSRLSEGKEINFDNLKFSTKDSLRASRAYVVYNKPYLAKGDERESYANVAIYDDTRLSSSDFFGKPKAFRFPNSRLLSSGSADLIAKRYVSRFGLPPITYKWLTEERFLTFKTGDVVEINSPELQGFDGEESTGNRAQILSVNPKYSKVGRQHAITAMTYSPSFSADDVIFRDYAQMLDVNLYDEAGRPNEAVNITFVFSNVKIGSSATNIPAMRAGVFVAGTTLTVIYINGTDHQARGGDGGGGGEYVVTSPPEVDLMEIELSGSAGAGGVCYDDNGIDTTIYLSGATGHATYTDADGYIRASGGGGGAGATTFTNAGHSGGGGAGISVGTGTQGALLLNSRGDIVDIGAPGGEGDQAGNGGTSSGTAGDGGAWGQDGDNGVYSGGSKGDGLAGSVTTIVGDTPTRFINGGGQPSL